MRHRFLTHALLFALLASTVPAARSAVQAPEPNAPPVLVLLVRHGEKASHQGEDPPLTAAGAARARALASALHDAGVTAIITTQLRRTRETAEPLAAAIGLKPEIVPVSVESDHLETHVQAVAAAVRGHPGGVVLVVGHQNTVPEIIAALGGPRLPTIRDPVYDNLFVLVPAAGQVHLVQTRYGAASPER